MGVSFECCQHNTTSKFISERVSSPDERVRSQRAPRAEAQAPGMPAAAPSRPRGFRPRRRHEPPAAPCPRRNGA